MPGSHGHADIGVRFEAAVWGGHGDMGRLEGVVLGEGDVALVLATFVGAVTGSVDDEVPLEDVVFGGAGIDVG